MKNTIFDTPVILENNGVRLEPLAQRHYASLLPVVLENPDLLKFSPSPFGTPEALQDYFDLALQQRRQQTRYAFAIFDKQTDTYAGSTSFGAISHEHSRLQIGWTWIGKDFQQTGLNRNCKYLMLQYAFEELRFERIEFVTDARNFQSQKAIEAIGGRFEGELRSHTLMSDGFRRNSRYYSILCEEWKEIKETRFAPLFT
ncbi:Protein N-acetyltransferase, RimJ/RimL family [Salinimicrobium sediminis]|uniref:Protein N-acetyltransferase, RimJ/RimL family n=1 Tax=Salinimicrobium sediminis TaxID=1343891 RepID=A0A285X9X2_9FLAO|nr:GNAT family N-acetyltransferase [Salinimicrobium sediminis]SOC81584.1 Protein N-acetyltransferase, RimJ/RimL family [Salinimicrobium sediminis]